MLPIQQFWRRYPGSGDVASVFCRRPAGVRVGGAENRGSFLTASVMVSSMQVERNAAFRCGRRLHLRSAYCQQFGQKPCAGTNSSTPATSALIQPVSSTSWRQTCLRCDEAMPIPFPPKEYLRMSRHTCALRFSSKLEDLRKVSLWLGHSSMQTTEITRGRSVREIGSAGVRHRAEVENRTIQGD